MPDRPINWFFCDACTSDFPSFNLDCEQCLLCTAGSVHKLDANGRKIPRPPLPPRMQISAPTLQPQL